MNPDGDAIGSQVALSSFLKKIGKTVHLANCDSTPRYFTFLEQPDKILVYDPDTHRRLLSNIDVGIVVDISDWKRLGALGRDMQDLDMRLICIDHHIPTDLNADVYLSDQSACSTGELLYDFFKWTGVEFDQLMLDALYTCLLTDTGSFRFTNTTFRTHEIVADLLRMGANFRKVYQHVYESYSPNRIRLTGHLMANMRFAANSRLAWFVLSQDLLEKNNVEPWEIEGLSELPRSIANVEISMMFTELSNGTTKVSFRSKGNLSIHKLANQFGGGGHPFAAGARIEESLSVIVPKVVDAAKELLSNTL